MANLVPKRLSTQRYCLNHLVYRPCRLQDALEIHEFLHIGMKVGLLLDGVADFQEKLLVDQRLDTANGEVWYKVLTVTQIAQVIEGIQKVGLEVKQGLGLVVHAEPKHTGHIVGTKKSSAVKVHREGLMTFRHLLASLDDGGDIIDRCAAEEFQRHVYLIGLHIVDKLLVLKIFLESFHHSRKFSSARNGDGQKSSFGIHCG